MTVELYVGLWLIQLPFAYSQCQWPLNIKNRIWLDSDKGELTFKNDTMTGLDYSIYTSVHVESWDCMLSNETSGILIVRSTSPISILYTEFRLFICLRLMAVTQYSYYYYIQTAKESNFKNERIAIRKEADVASITDMNAVSEFCNGSDLTVSEFHVLIRKDREGDAAQQCPVSFHGEFWYSVYDGVRTTCGSMNERWTVGVDLNTMTFNYSLCSTVVANSASGSVRCLVSITYGNISMTSVMDTANSSSNLTFTCLMSEVLSNGSVLVSQSSKSCTADQTPWTLPVHSDGTMGLLIMLSPLHKASSYPNSFPDSTRAVTSETTSSSQATVNLQLSTSSSSIALVTSERTGNATLTLDANYLSMYTSTKQMTTTAPSRIIQIETTTIIKNSSTLLEIIIGALVLLIVILIMAVAVLLYKRRSQAKAVKPVQRSSADPPTTTDAVHCICLATPRLNSAVDTNTQNEDIAVKANTNVPHRVWNNDPLITDRDSKHKHSNVNITNKCRNVNTKLFNILPPILPRSESMPCSIAKIGTTAFPEKLCNAEKALTYPIVSLNDENDYKKSTHITQQMSGDVKPRSTKLHILSTFESLQEEDAPEQTEDRWRCLRLESPDFIQITNERSMHGTSSSLCIVSSAR